jgi:acyl dehydratase
MKTPNKWQLFSSVIRHFGSGGLNRDMIGFVIKQDAAPVRTKDIIAYAAATNDNNPLYSESRPVAPPFFLSKLIFPAIQHICIHKELKMNLLRMVHAEQELSWHGPVYAGDQLNASIRILDIYDTPAGEMIQISAQAYRSHELVAESIAGLMIRSRKKRGKKIPRKSEPLREMHRIEIQTEEDQALRYAAASGDHNFIHTSPFLAKLAGLPRTILHGVCIMAMTGAALAAHTVNSDISRLSGMKGRFAHPAFPGQQLTLIIYESPHDGEIPFDVLNPMGKPVFRDGSFKFRNQEN